MTLLQEYSIILLSHIFTAVFLISKIDCMRQNVGKTHRYRSSGNNAVVDNMGIPLCPDIPARYAFLKPNTKVGDIISGAPPSAAGFPSLYYIKDGNEHRLFSIDKNSGKVYVATPISLPLLMMNHKLTIIVSSGLKTCSLKIFIQAAAFKQGSERSFLVPSPRVDLMDKFAEQDTVDPEPRQLFLPGIPNDPRNGMPLESDLSPPNPPPQQQNVVPNPAFNIAPNPQDALMGAVYVVPPQQNAVFANQLNTIPNQPFNVFTTELPILTTTALDQLVTSPFVPVPVEAMDMFISKQAALPPASGFGAQSQSQQVINTNGIISQFPVLPSAGGNYPSATQDNTQPASNATLQRPPPSCSQPLYTGIVSENAPIGTFVVRAIATGDRIQWSISDTAFERFSVNPTTGEVSVAGSLKRRTRAAMEFKLRATDAFGLWCDAVVRINVVSDSSATPSNYPPYFTQNYYYFTIQCGTSGQRVGSVVASDTDAGQTISYQVINTNEFSVDANGNIQSTTPIQTSSQRTFVVTAVDTGFPPQTATTTVVVSVAGSCGAVNNANTPPTFSQTNYVLSASCRVNGVFVGMISARDYENNAITYTLRGTNEFNINPTTGELRAQGSLNDAAPRTFSVVATDNGVPPMSSVATVSVNVANCSPPNNPPTFSQSAFQFTVPCDTVIGTTIGSAQAYDSEANQIVYSLTGTQEFSVNSATGLMSLTSPLQGIGVRQYGILATDNGQPPLSSSAGITVVVNGNCGPQAATTTPTPAPFTAPPTPFTSPPLFLTTAPSIPTPPFFQQQVFSGTVPCLTSAGSTIGTFPATYSAGQQFLTYSLAGTNEFIVNNNGAITNAVVLPSGATRTFTLVASDPRYPSATASAQIIINVGICPQTPPTTSAPIPRPAFPQSQYVATVSCITSPGFVIGTMTAQYSLPQQLTYNLAGTNAFTIDNSGRLTNTLPLDGAVVPSYTFTVIASDSRNTASSATAVVVINVQPCIASTTPTTTAITTPPVAPPSFQLAQYFANISCLTTPGFLIGTITAQYSRPLTYSLVNTNAFTVDNFGQVTNTGPVNGAVVPTYFFSIVARDTANPAISATAQVVISVGSCVAPVATTQPTLPPTVPTAPTPPPFVFTTPPFIFTTPPFVFPTPGPTTSAPFLPTPPRFSQQQYVFNIACQNNPGFPVGAVSVQYQQPQQLTLTLTNTNDFRIDNSGQITANVPMNGAQRPVHNFNAVAQDSFNPSLSATAQIVVNVAACSFTTQPTFPPTLPPTTPAPLPPQFPQGQYVFNVQCLNNIGSPIGTTIAQYSQPQQLVYNLINTNSFAINNGGQISNTVLLNGAIQPSNTFTVVAADSRNPVLSGTAQIIVNVAACITPGTPAPVTFPPTLPPTQPPRPVFPQAQYTANVSCLTSVGFLVGTITAQYPQQLVYTLQNTNTFNVDNFGQIRNVIPLNGAQLPSSTFFIVAADPSNPSNSASAQITVFVGVCPTPPPTTSVAVFTPPVTFPTPPPVFTFPTPPTTPRPTPPQFSQSQYTTSVACQSQPGFPIGTVTAQYSQPNQLSYTLSGTNSFSVNNAGQITNTVPLDGAFIPTHTFTITAIDARNPLLSASAQILVTVAACTTTTPIPILTTPQPRPPVFSQNVYFVTAACLSNPGSTVGSVQATDPSGAPVVYRLTGTPSEFDVDISRGNIVVTRQPTSSGFRTIIVVATGVNPSLTASATVQIVINEPCTSPTPAPFTNPITFATTPTPIITTTLPVTLPPPPRFTQGLYFFTYGCASSSNQPVGSVQATGNQITYSLQGTNAFTISNTGEIRAVSPPQGSQTVTFQVVASDNSGGAVRADVAQVQISVSACTTPQPAQPPFFQQATYSMVISCPSSPNVLVGTVTAQYSQPQNLVYNLVNANQFSVDNRGEIRSTVLLNSGSNYFFTVTASDNRNPSLSASAQVSVNVLPCTTLPFAVPTPPPILTTPPVLIAFTQALYSFLATCPITANQVVGSVQAFGTNIRYGLSGTTNFTISQSGQISTVGTLQGPLLLPFRVTATGPDGTSVGADVQVSVPSCLVPTQPTQPPPVTPATVTPTFAQSAYTFTIACPSSANILIGTITAQYSQPQNLVYSLFNSNEFSVDNFGEIRSTVLLSPATSYTFALIATDARNAAAVAITRVTVEVSPCGGQTTPPSIFATTPEQLIGFNQAAYAFTTTCQVPANQIIGNVQGYGTGIRYSLTGTNTFTISPTGQISTLGPLQGPQVIPFQATVSAPDGTSFSVTVNISIPPCLGPTLPPLVTPGQLVSTPTPNAAPYFTNPTYTFTMVCNSQPGTSIGSVYAIDDSSQVVYSVQSPSFTINRSSGEIFTSSPITSNTPITFTVTASDNQGLTGQASVTVSVNGCGVPTPSVPVINQPTAITVSVCDPATNMVVPGMALGFVSASSPSAGNGPAGGLQFTILNDRRFSVNSATGQISAAATLDSGSYLFQVQVVDPRLPQLSSSATFTVIVDCTSITYRPCNPASVEATVSEGAAVGVTVITLSGNNVAPVNNRPYSSPYTSSSSSYYNNIPTYYSQQASFPSEQYAIPPTAYYGNYPSAGGLGGNSNSLSDQYASLGGSGRGYRALPMLRRAAPPRMVFRERRQTGGSLLASLQSPVGSAFAGNGMGGSTGVQGWSILQASVPGQFRVDANSGRVYVAQPLDRERTDSYVLRVRNSYGNQACVTRVGIDVLDVNDNAPIFNNATYAFTAPCGTSSALIGVVTARDADSGLRGFVTYSILNSDNSVFTIDTFSGEIRSRTSIGAGALPQSLTIQADNPTTPSRSTTTTATVNPGAGC